MTIKQAQLLASGHPGIYIPQMFAKIYDLINAWIDAGDQMKRKKGY